MLQKQPDSLSEGCQPSDVDIDIELNQIYTGSALEKEITPNKFFTITKPIIKQMNSDSSISVLPEYSPRLDI